ncbi:MAG: Methionyl-tRNA formyltransferase [Chlamydiae bacterium]|nr:Methionyl-tRNA formyltransferase [Chlamydiota bacterium]
MKVVFFGTPPFAANVLSFLLENGVDVVAVVTKPDKPKGRSRKPVPTPVKTVAIDHDPQIPFFQPEKASSPEFADLLPPFDVDLFVVVAYGEILRQHILDMPRLGCINVHASLLPKYRGAAPIQRCIIEGEDETGISIMHMVRKMDAGDIIRVEKVSIGPNDTFGEVEQKLCDLGSKALLEVIREFEKGNTSEVPQDESLVTYAQKIELEDCEIDWNQSAEAIHNLVRGVNPYPGAWCFVTTNGEKKRVKIWSTRIVSDVSDTPGKILSCDAEGMIVSCGEGAVRILELQLEGKKSMPPGELQRGTPINFQI